MEPNINTIYSDYEKIVPSEKLGDFLFEDYFHIFDKTTWVKESGEGELLRVLQSTIQKYNKYKLGVGFLDKVFLKLHGNKNKKNILFQSFKYSDIISKAKKDYNVGFITSGKRERLSAIKNFTGYVGVDDLSQYILDYLKDKNVEHIYRLIKEVEVKLMTVKPDCIVLWNDVLPIERAIILVSRKLGITTIEIQHGIYLPPFFPFINGRAADYIFVWGKHFKDLYVNQKVRKSENVYVLGYPYLIKAREITKKTSKIYAVCCLGEAFERFNKDFLAITLKNIKSLSEMCKKLGLEFVYRPHPADDRELLQKNLEGVQFTGIGEKLEETFDWAEIFIGFASTALIEAKMNEKVSLQLMNYPLKLDNFEKLGICDKSFENIIDLENYLVKMVSASSLDKNKVRFNTNYIETRYNPGGRFLEIIKKIENKNRP